MAAARRRQRSLRSEVDDVSNRLFLSSRLIFHIRFGICRLPLEQLSHDKWNMENHFLLARAVLSDEVKIQRQKRLKTVEILVEETTWTPRIRPIKDDKGTPGKLSR